LPPLKHDPSYATGYKISNLYSVVAPNLSADRVCAVPYRTALIDLFQKRAPFRENLKKINSKRERKHEPYCSENLSVFVKSAIRTAKNFIF
jgi:hypothetical protein